MTFFQASLKELLNNELSLEEIRNAFSELEIKNVVDFKEKKKLRKRLIKACMIENPTWYSWMQKRQIPKPSQKLIALELGECMECLFPNN